MEAVQLRYSKHLDKELCEFGYLELPQLMQKFREQPGGGVPAGFNSTFFSFKNSSLTTKTGEVQGLSTRDELGLGAGLYYFIHPAGGAGRDLELKILCGRDARLIPLGEIRETARESVWAPSGSLDPKFAAEVRENRVSIVSDGTIHAFSYHPSGINSTNASLRNPLIEETIKNFGENRTDHKYYKPGGDIIA